MILSPLAGKPAPAEILIDLDGLERAYYEERPTLDDPEQRVRFGAGGHRGSSGRGSFNEAHILAITQAICDYRCQQGVDGPLHLGKDTHVLSGPAERTVLEVLAANGVTVVMQRNDGVTPAPVISRAILVHNRGRRTALADGIVVSPSHDPPEDGGITYNPPHGGPPDTELTGWIEARANELLQSLESRVRRIPFARAISAATTHQGDLVLPYVRDLATVLDMEAIRDARVTLSVDALGGAALGYWEPISTVYKLDVTALNTSRDPRFAFMTVDHDGVIRMDCSSPFAMEGLIGLRGDSRVAFGTDPDAGRHGVVTPTAGLMHPDHYLAVAIHYLATHRPRWPRRASVGKTLVSSSMIDKVVQAVGRRLHEVPLGFTWFAPGLFGSTLCFGGDESAGASFLRRDGTVWTTDRDGLVMGLLAAEMTAQTARDPGEHYQMLTAELGRPCSTRIDVLATPGQRMRLGQLSAQAVTIGSLAGEPIIVTQTRAPGNGAPLGGLKVVTASGWFVARPSSTKNLYTVYAESFKDEGHLGVIVGEAQELVDGL